MSLKRQHIQNLLKQLPFLLVLCAMLVQPIANTFSVFSDTSYEFVDYDMEDDTEEEVENTIEEDIKIEPQPNTTTIAYCDLSNNNANHYLQASRWSFHLDILIPPPEQA